MQSHERHSAGCRDVNLGSPAAPNTSTQWEIHTECQDLRQHERGQGAASVLQGPSGKQETRHFDSSQNFNTEINQINRVMRHFPICSTGPLAAVVDCFAKTVPAWVGVCCGCSCSLNRGELSVWLSMSRSMSENAVLIRWFTFFGLGASDSVTQHRYTHTHIWITPQELHFGSGIYTQTPSCNNKQARFEAFK